MNKAILIGRISTDINLRFIPTTGTAVANFNLAVDNPFKKDADGKIQADFIRVIVFGKRAESLAEHMKKGRLLGVSGRITTSSYEDKEGNKRYSTEVTADEVQFIDWGGNKKPAAQDNDFGMTLENDGDLPF